MIKTRNERFLTSFERTYGAGSWAKFQAMVLQEVRPQAIQSKFVSKKTSLPMGKPAYYKWEARARESQ